MRRKITRTNKQDSNKRVSDKPATTESEVKRLEIEEGQQLPIASTVEESPSGETTVQSAWPGKIILPEAPSGALYVWHRTGEMILVADEDVEFVMGYNRSGRACCGSGGRTYFVIADQ
jgi:hypothetical protein